MKMEIPYGDLNGFSFAKQDSKPASHDASSTLNSDDGWQESDQHAANVAWLTGYLCAKLSISDALTRKIVSGARTHDVGKFFVPSDLLARRGPLNLAEREVVQQHAVHGALILDQWANDQKIDLSVEISVALSHHEHWDGTGYPIGWSKRQISQAARIVAVADVFDALTSVRPYKQAWSIQNAVQSIIAGSGTHFDPVCVDALVEIIPLFPNNWNHLAAIAHRAVNHPLLSILRRP